MELSTISHPAAEMMASAASIVGAGLGAAQAIENRRTVIAIGVVACGVGVGAAIGIHFLRKASRAKPKVTPSI